MGVSILHGSHQAVFAHCAMDTLTLSEATDLYLQHRPHLASGTVSGIRRLSRFCLKVLGDVPIQKIKESDIWRLHAELSQPGCPKYAASEAMRWLKTILTECWRLRLLDEVPRHWPTGRIPPRMPDAWSIEQVAQLHAVATEMPGQIVGVRAADWWTAWLLTAWDTALRVSQMFAIRWGDVFLERRMLVVRARPATKSYRDRLQGLSPETCQALERIHGTNGAPDKPVFAWPDWPTSRRDFFSVFRYMCYSAGLPTSHSEPLQLTHRLRRSSITAAALVSLEAARKQAGHSRVEITVEHYVDPRLLPTVPLVPRLPISDSNRERTLFDLRK